jgi:hypothetical protein
MNSFDPFAARRPWSCTGATRGEHFQVRAEYSPNPPWKAYCHYEPLLPRDFYMTSRASALEVQA